ncbi:MAG: hypothetical protein WKF71_19460 [Pyrinomonadaceae bacterium]
MLKSQVAQLNVASKLPSSVKTRDLTSDRAAHDLKITESDNFVVGLKYKIRCRSHNRIFSGTALKDKSTLLV